MTLPAFSMPVAVRRVAGALLFTATIVPSAFSQAPKPVDYSSESLVIEKADTTYRYNEDGTGEKFSTVRIRLQTEAGVRQFSVVGAPFAASTEKASIQSLVVRHADGTTTETPPSDAMEMPSPVSAQAPFYSDLKVLQLPVRGLRTGDTLEFTVHVERKNPETPSQFWDRYQFNHNVVVLSETLTLDVPALKYVQQWSRSVKPDVSESAGRKIFVWHSSQLKPSSSGEKKEQDDADPKEAVTADVEWSTFHTWAEVGEWYRTLSASRANVSDAIHSQAEEITRDAKTPTEQVEALYAWVSTHIRYVGIDFGVGRFRPHTAAEVLAARYGDCKDKDTLFEAFLHAKGFTSSPALIGANLELVPELPSPGSFNHVITTIDLPTGRVWADTTAGVAPFQMLLAPLRDKQALVIPPQGAPVLVRTPASPPFPIKDQFQATANLNRDGELTGKADISFRSESEIVVRAIALNLPSTQWDQGAQAIVAALGFGGTVTNSKFDGIDDVEQPMRMHYDYSKKPYGDWDRFRILPLLPVNSLPQAPDKQPAKEIELGLPRTEVAISRIHLPAGFGADLPNAVHVKSQFASVDMTYRLENGDFIVERQIVVAMSKVPTTFWEEYRKFAKDISLGDVEWIQLTSMASAGAGAHPPRPGESNPDAEGLIHQAQELERQREWKAVLEKLDEAKKLNPEQAYLWSNYGYVAMSENRPEEAADDFRHELAHHPEEAFVAKLFARFLVRRSLRDEAISVLQSSFDRDPSEPQVAGMLAGLQANKNLNQAIATLHKAIEAKPQGQLMSQLAPLLLRNGSTSEAREVAGKLLNLAGDDPLMLNDGAYFSAEAGGDLPAAEKAVRKALDILDGQTSNETVAEANQQSFTRSSLLVAAWDTLGYILLQEKKIDESLDYLEPAWRNNPDVAGGLHYGSALEMAGKKAEAFRIYTLSTSGMIGETVKSTPEWPSVQRRIQALKKDGVTLPPQSGYELSQQERTFKFKLPYTCKSYQSAIFRVQFSGSGEPQVLQVEGKALSEDYAASLKSLHLAHMVPFASKARILRNAAFTCSAEHSSAYVVLMPPGVMDTVTSQ